MRMHNSNAVLNANNGWIEKRYRL